MGESWRNRKAVSWDACPRHNWIGQIHSTNGFYDGSGTSGCLRCIKKNGTQSIGRSSGGLTTKVHAITANEKEAVELTLSPGQCHDAPQGRILMETVGKQDTETPLVMDKAYEDEETWMVAQLLKFVPVVPPKSNRKNPWEYDKELYKQRNMVERFFRRLQGFRRIFCRYEKLDIMYMGFIHLALVFVSIK